MELVRVRTDEIVCVKADGNYSDLVVANGKTHKMTFQLHFFEETFQKLHDNMFVRVGKSLIVNRRYIYIINILEQLLVLAGGGLCEEVRVKASKEALKELKQEIEKGGRYDD